jgi:probable phosphoglycerate mutase
LTIQLLFIRHAITDWNQQRRIQGCTDIALSDAGRAHLKSCSLPFKWRHAICYTSTLARTIETAQLLNANAIHPTPLLREMHWGLWEGQTLAQMRQSDPENFAENERRGLDFRPDGGESPREVRTRLEGWLSSLEEDLQQAIVITHKGVIRAAISLASDWDMQSKYKHSVDWSCAHEFSYSIDKGLALEHLNVSLGCS